MKHARSILCAAVLVSAVWTPGCKKGESFSLGSPFQGLLGPSRSELVEMAFDRNDPDRRREGVERLSSHEWGRSEQYLRGYVILLETDKDASVRCAAVRAIGRSADPKFMPNVVAALDDPAESVRMTAARALDQSPFAEAVGPLQKHALLDSAKDVRMWSAMALRHYRRQEVLVTLVRCLEDESYDVCYQAHAALVELTGRDLGSESDDWQQLVAKGIENLPEGPKRPWWDWFGVTVERPARQVAGDQVQTRPVKPTRPWWDWLGVTVERPDRQAGGDRAETRPAKPSRPWWDWFGVTVKKSDHQAGGDRAETRPAKPTRPWWDWFGVTVKKSQEKSPDQDAARDAGGGGK